VHSLHNSCSPAGGSRRVPIGRLATTGAYLGLLVWLIACRSPSSSAEITVSAASNLIPAFEEIRMRYESETGNKVVFNFGASGKLAQQIEQGAPVDLFVSADSAYVTDLAGRGFVRPETVRAYALGRLALWTPDSAGYVPQTVHDLIRPEIRRVAIANPSHAPYGRVARQVLETSGLWSRLQDKLIMADNVQQTLQYAQTGNVDVALVPLSLVINLPAGQYSLVPASAHQPILQSLGIVSASRQPAAAQTFADFVTGPEGREVLAHYGYDLTP
jgi:molybdate transport system substrate-binding protein